VKRWSGRLLKPGLAATVPGFIGPGEGFPFGPWAAFKRLTDKEIDVIAQKLSKKREKKKEKKDPLIRCSSCKSVITTMDSVVSVAGQHRHTFKNPAGIYYEIGCFSSAKGCFNMGEPTFEYTWFPGYNWCYSVCGRCFIHLGWYYQSGDSHFYGLILNRLTSAGDR
jgi:hypothetical protein